MNTAPSQPLSQPASSRLFYPLAALALLAITFIGFRLFYLHMQAYPGRPLTPPLALISSTAMVTPLSQSAWSATPTGPDFAVGTPMMIGSAAKSGVEIEATAKVATELKRN